MKQANPSSRLHSTPRSARRSLILAGCVSALLALAAGPETARGAEQVLPLANFTQTQLVNPSPGTQWTLGGGVWTVGSGVGVRTGELLSPVFTFDGTTGGGPVAITFNHAFQFENNFDGGLLQVSINGGGFVTVANTAFTLNGYNGITIGFSTPFGNGTRIFTSDTLTTETSTATLGVFAVGDTVQLRWRGGWDSATVVASPNWQLNSASLLTPDAANYWKGGASSVWTGVNWTTDAAGNIASAVGPGTITDVTFSATGAANRTTTLGADFTIHSLTITDPVAVTINAGGAFALTISGLAGTGIDVQAGAAAVTIGAPVTLAGSSDTITVNNTAGLTISGALTSANNLIKDGTGTLKLTGNNNVTGTTLVKDGTLQLQGPTSNTMITNTLTVGDGVDAPQTAVLELQAFAQIGNAVGVVVNSDGRFINLAESLGALTINGGLVETGATGALQVSSLDMTAGSITGNQSLFLPAGVAVTTNAAATAATIGSGSLSLQGASHTFTVADGAAASDLVISAAVTNRDPFGNPALFPTGGAIVKAGLGTLELTNNNTFTDGVTINAGTVLANNTVGSATGAGPVAINGGGTLGGSGRATGPVTLGNGGFIAPGAVATGISTGTLTTGALTWNSGGTLNLQLGANNAASDLLAVNGTLTRGGAGVFGVNVADAGGFGGQALYTLATFTGGTTFALVDFTLLALPAGFTGTLSLDGDSLDLLLLAFAAGGNTIQNSAPVGTPTFADFTVNQPVTTGGPTENNTIRTLTFTPGGSLTIFNTLFVTQGPVNLVPGSSLNLGTSPLGNATLSASQLNVLFGGTLSGNGTINGNLINSGLVSPGNSPGVIYVSGYYRQTSTGTLRIEIGGTDESEYDRLIVAGTAELDGTLELVRLNKFKLKRGDKITFLTAGGGVSGEFAHVSNAFTSDTILAPEVIYEDTKVSLELVRQSFEKYAEQWGLTPNQRAVAEVLDSVSAEKPNDKALVYLDGRKLDKLPGDFDKIAPEELTSIFTISTALANVQSINLQRRTDDIRSGSSGFSAGGFAMQGTGPGYSGGLFGAAGPSGKESKEVREVAPVEEKKWGAFLTGVGEWVDVDGDGNARGYDITTGGFTLGLDYKVSPNFAIGVAAGYAGTAADLTNDGRVWVNGGKLGLYATFFQNPTGGAAGPSGKDVSKEAPAPASIIGSWYVDLAVNGGYNSYETKRSALQGAARGSTEGGELNVLVGTGYDWKIGALSIGPTATLNYSLVGMDGYTEHGSLAPLSIASRNAESVRTALGFKASYDWKLGGLIVKPEIRAAWQHEYGDSSYALDASFANGAGSGFLVNGPEIGRDSLLIGAGVAVQCSERCSTYLYYDGELARTRYDSHSVSGGFRVAF